MTDDELFSLCDFGPPGDDVTISAGKHGLAVVFPIALQAGTLLGPYRAVKLGAQLIYRGQEVEDGISAIEAAVLDRVRRP